jgi:hypothetical protein
VSENSALNLGEPSRSGNSPLRLPRQRSFPRHKDSRGVRCASSVPPAMPILAAVRNGHASEKPDKMGSTAAHPMQFETVFPRQARRHFDNALNSRRQSHPENRTPCLPKPGRFGRAGSMTSVPSKSLPWYYRRPFANSKRLGDDPNGERAQAKLRNSTPGRARASRRAGKQATPEGFPPPDQRLQMRLHPRQDQGGVPQVVWPA